MKFWIAVVKKLNVNTAQKTNSLIMHSAKG